LSFFGVPNQIRIPAVRNNAVNATRLDTVSSGKQ
jgi:hypothetical protein